MLDKLEQIAISCVVSATLLSGCSVSTKDPRDPMENWNRNVQSFNDTVDSYAIKPVAKGYAWLMPSFADQAVTNLFGNVSDIGVTVNDLLQFKFAQSSLDGSRFLVNSVAGLGGFVDVADLIGLEKHKEDFDQTLAVWGIPTGPYVVLPILGASSPRGAVGRIGDAAMNPVNYVSLGASSAIGSAVSGGTFALNSVDMRADNLATEKVASEAALDRYEFFKNAYFQQRDYLVNDGRVNEKLEK